MKKCSTCIHNEVCLWLWEFAFKNTTSRIQEREDFDLDMMPHCGHYFEDKFFHTEIKRPLACNASKKNCDGCQGEEL